MRFLAKTISIILLISFLATAGYLIYYPNSDEVKLYTRQRNPEKIAQNTSLRILTTLSPRSVRDDFADSISGSSIAVEKVDSELLAQYRNSGQIVSKVESDNTALSIESADISGKIFDGEDAYTMERGLWHFPLSRGPGEKGNFVIIGHRFDKLPPATDTFYNLDKVDIGDKIKVAQKGGVEYIYTVTEKTVVEKDNREVLASTNQHTITLITCEPLWTSDKRLVIVGVLDKVYRKV